MLVIDLRNKRILSKYSYAVVGNKDSDVIRLYSHLVQYANYNIYLKVLSDVYADKIDIPASDVSIEDDTLVVDWTMDDASCSCDKLMLQLQFEKNGVIAQSSIAIITLGNTLNISEIIEPQYPRVLEHLQEEIDALGDLDTIVDVSYEGGVFTFTKNDGTEIEIDLSNDYASIQYVDDALEEKVDKEQGKGLSSNDYTDTDKNKLAGIEAGAQVNALEGVQMRGVDLPINNKKVNINNTPLVFDATEYRYNTVPSEILEAVKQGDIVIADGNMFAYRRAEDYIHFVITTVDEDGNTFKKVQYYKEQGTWYFYEEEETYIIGNVKMVNGEMPDEYGNVELNVPKRFRVQGMHNLPSYIVNQLKGGDIVENTNEGRFYIVQLKDDEECVLTSVEAEYLVSQYYLKSGNTWVADEMVSFDLNELSSRLSSHVNNKANPHEVTKAQVGLGNVDNTSDANKPVSTAQQTAINAVDDKLNANVHVEGNQPEITYNGDVVTKVSPYKNLKTGATGSRSEQIELADDTHAGMMSHTDYLQIRENTARIEQLEGQTTRLLYTTSQNPTAQQIADFVDAWLAGKGIVNPTDEDYAGIAVVIAGTFHIWHYYANQTPNWRDDGVDTTSQFTNALAGVIKGKDADGFVYAENDGTGSVKGWGDLKTRVSNLESNDQTQDTAIGNLQNDKVDKVTGKGLSTNDFTDTYKGNVDDNTTARHTHNNKALLDTYDQTNADIKTAVDDAHTHSNKALLDTYSQTEANLADAVSKKHSHSNKSILDATTASYTTAEATKLSGIETGAQVNDIEGVQVNGVDLTPDANKKVNVSVPTKVSDLNNDSHFVTESDMSYITTAPSSANTSGVIKIVLLPESAEATTTMYNGYIYIFY